MLHCDQIETGLYLHRLVFKQTQISTGLHLNRLVEEFGSTRRKRQLAEKDLAVVNPDSIGVFLPITRALLL